jgi:parallel beta-helix repeat protein
MGQQSRIEKNAYGVYIFGVSSVALDGSTITNNGGYGVSVGTVSSATVSGCTISNTAGCGICAAYNSIVDATGSIVSGNNPNTHTSTGGIIFGI